MVRELSALDHRADCLLACREVRGRSGHVKPGRRLRALRERKARAFLSGADESLVQIGENESSFHA